MEPFVCVQLLGGLGNQLFQYAAAKAVQKNSGGNLLLNKESNNPHNTNGHNYVKELFTDAAEVDISISGLQKYQFTSTNFIAVAIGAGSF